MLDDTALSLRIGPISDRFDPKFIAVDSKMHYFLPSLSLSRCGA